jgi:hypothetical protein
MPANIFLPEGVLPIKHHLLPVAATKTHLFALDGRLHACSVKSKMFLD